MATVPGVEPPPYTLADIGKLFQTAPIIFCATHGEYDLSSKEYSAIVPANTLVFETTNIGDLCLDPIDKPLWELAQGTNREIFWNYLMDKGGISGGESRGKYRDTLAQLIMYGPGDRIPIRKLSIGSTPRDMMMGFYKLLAGTAYPYPPRGVAKTMEDFDISLRNEDIFTTNSAVMKRGNTLSPVGPKIYIFLSCAIHAKISKGSHINNWSNIAALQQAARLRTATLGISTLSGGASAPVRFSEYTPPSGMAKSIEDANALMMSVGNAPVRESTNLCKSGYGILVVKDGHMIQPLQNNGRFCFTPTEFQTTIADLKEKSVQIYAITKYDNDGMLISGTINPQFLKSQGGGRRRTLRNRKRRLNKSKRNRGNARV